MGIHKSQVAAYFSDLYIFLPSKLFQNTPIKKVVNLDLYDQIITFTIKGEIRNPRVRISKAHQVDTWYLKQRTKI